MLLLASAGEASETIKYTYDALGRLTGVTHVGWPVDQGMVSSYQYDMADNRSNVTVVQSWTSRAWRSGDFNGDHRTDLLWTSDSGTVIDWLAQPDGSFVDNSSNLNLTPGPTWHVVGLGDFNGDGYDDILWQNDDGTLHEWLGQANGTVVGNLTNFNVNPGPQWHVVGVGDFNGDGRADILLQKNDGTVIEWLGQPNGSFVDNSVKVNTNPGNTWHVVGVGDVDGDGRADIIWQNDDGTVHDWLGQPDGSFVGNLANLNLNLGPTWHVIAVGDFNCDGRADILWRNDNGDVAEWTGTSNGSFVQNSSIYYNVATILRVAAVGNFTGASNRCDDIIWRSVTGDVTEWMGSATGAFYANSAVSTNMATNWHIEPR